MKPPGLLAIVAYNRLRTFEYAIVSEVFALVRPSLGVARYDTIVVSPDRGKLSGPSGMHVAPTAAFERIGEARTLRAAVRRKARVVSICSGSFVLGYAGLLDGRRATTHWLYADEFRERFPLARYEDDVLYVDEGDIVTSAGAAAGVDACRHIVRRDYGARIANMVARRMVVAPHREGGQAQYVETPVAQRPGRGIGAALDWARRRLDRPIAVTELAGRSAMSPRTFFRRFGDQMGMQPSEWLQKEGIARARAPLEAGQLSLAEISGQCGYESPETFRAAFKRVTSVAPGEYRRRFKGAGA